MCVGVYVHGALISQADDGMTLRDHLLDDADYHLLPRAAWLQLVEWYGEDEHRAIPIPRRVMLGSGSQRVVEVYPMCLTINAKLDGCIDSETEFKVFVSRRARGCLLLQRAVDAFLDAESKQQVEVPSVHITDADIDADLATTAAAPKTDARYFSAKITVGALTITESIKNTLEQLTLTVSGGFASRA